VKLKQEQRLARYCLSPVLGAAEMDKKPFAEELNDALAN
jgi:hypothetical protein